MPIPGKIEVTIKIKQLPEHETAKDGLKHFLVEADGNQAEVVMKPKMFKKLEEANQKPPDSWVAAITGKVGSLTVSGFTLLDPNLQIFDRKPKSETATAPAAP